MNILYLDCGMGAAGDMLTAALLELLPDPEGFLRELNGLGLPGVVTTAERGEKGGLAGTHVKVTVCGQEEGEPSHHPHPHGHSHRGLEEIRRLVAGLALPEPVKTDILAVYESIAQGESQAHGVPVDQVHFHEVGALDAVADVTAVCLLLHRLAPDRIVASPVCVGSGTVRCAHGELPVPAPATAWLLRGVPVYGSDFPGELCTPTGAALLRHFVAEFGPMPLLRPEKTGCGLGKKDFPRANCLRAIWGEGDQAPQQLLELCCNLDDLTGEALGFAQERLWEAGALDVWTVPLGMKKSRPGVMLGVLCREDQGETMRELLFRYTTTMGIRERPCRRYALERREEQVQTALGPVRRKVSTGYGIRREKYEYEDLAALARERGWPLDRVLRELK